MKQEDMDRMRTDQLIDYYGIIRQKEGAYHYAAEYDKAHEAAIDARQVQQEIVLRLRHFPELVFWKTKEINK